MTLSIQEIDGGMIRLKGIWYAMVALLAVYVFGVCSFMLGMTAAFGAEIYEKLHMMLCVVAGSTLAASWPIRWLLLAIDTR